MHSKSSSGFKQTCCLKKESGFVGNFRQLHPYNPYDPCQCYILIKINVSMVGMVSIMWVNVSGTDATRTIGDARARRCREMWCLLVPMSVAWSSSTKINYHEDSDRTARKSIKEPTERLTLTPIFERIVVHRSSVVSYLISGLHLFPYSAIGTRPWLLVVYLP